MSTRAGRGLWQTLDMENSDREPRRASPPYGAFVTYWEFVEELAQRGPIPQVIDDGVIGKSKGGTWEIVSALKFFGQIDRERRPTVDGIEFLAAPTPGVFKPFVEDKYEPVIRLGLANAIPSQVDKVLLDMGATDSSIIKVRRFFIHAAQKVGIEVGPHLKLAPASSRPARRPRTRPTTQTRTETHTRTLPGDLRTQYIEMLMEKAKAQDEPSDDLLNRIEKALEMTPSKD